MALIGYGAGGLLLADSLATQNGLEFLIASILLFGGALAQLASKATR